jgi:glycosyltransferase involved in cell wall biosynthesis
MTGETLAFYVPWLTVGGVQRVTTTITNGLAARGHDVDLVVSYQTGDLLDEVHSDVRIVDLQTPQIPGIGIGASLPALRTYLSRREPSMLFSQMTYANVLCLLARRLTNVDTQVFATEHNTFGMKDDLKERLTNRVAARMYPYADEVLAVSSGVADSVAAATPLSRSEVTVMYNPVDVADVRARAAEPVDHPWLESDEHEVVLSVGRLAEAKDLETWLRAFAHIVERRPNARGILAGRGPVREEMESLATELGLEDVVDFPGFVDNPYGYMADASVFMLSSRHEGLPTVLIEALACGCPVVSTDCPSGPHEILQGGEYGRLVDVGDEQALADAVVQTLESPLSQEVLRERADAFGLDTILDEYERFIRAHED